MDGKFLAQQFEADRAHLTRVAYRMLGSLPEAEDAVQEGWLRLSRGGSAHGSPAWLWATDFLFWDTVGHARDNAQTLIADIRAAADVLRPVYEQTQ